MDVVQLGMAIDTRDADKGVRAAKRFGDETSKAGRTVATATTSMAKNWKVAAAAVGAAVIALRSLGGAITVLRQFENSMAAVGAISRASVQDLAAMRDVAKDLGSTTEFTAAQAADGMRFLAMAGFQAKEAMAAIPDVLDLATASGMGLAEAADIASNIMSAFSIEAENAADVTDALAAVSSRANTNVQQLGDAMKFVGPVAAALGMGINDTAAAMGVLSDNGLQGSLAGTGLRKVLSSLVNPTNEAADALAAMGLNLEDLNPQTNDLTDIVDRLAEAGLGASDALTIFGDRGGPAILALTNSRGRLRELTAEMRNVEGAAGDMAAQMRDNLEGDAMSLVSAIQGLIIAFGDAGLTTVLRTLIQTVTLVTRGFTAMVDAIAALPGYVAEFLGMGAAQRELADAADAVAIAMNEEIAKSDVLNGTLSEGRTMSVDTARVKLVQARAHLQVADAMRQEAVEQVKLSQEYQRIKLAADGAREMMRALQDQAANGVLPDSAVVNIERARSILEAASNEMRRLEAEAGKGSEEFENAQAQVALLETAINNADDGMVTLGGSIVAATGNAAGLTAQMQAAAEAARGIASTLEGGRSSGSGGDMVGGPRFKRQTIEEQAAPFLDNDNGGGGGGGGGGGMSEAQQRRNALLEEGKRLTLEMRDAQAVYNDALARNNELLQMGAIDQDTYKAANQVLHEQMANAQWGEQIQMVEDLSAGLLNAAMNGENLGEALIQMLAQMAIQWLSAAIAARAADILSGGILSASMGASGGGGGPAGMIMGLVSGGRASGGPVEAGKPYLVNEGTANSEIFVPSQSGGVLNVAQSQRALAGAAGQPNVTVQAAPAQVIVLNDPREIDQHMMSPEGERARAKADRRMS